MKIKKTFKILLILLVVIGLFALGGITASAMAYIEDIYLKPEITAIETANNITGSYFEVTAHCEDGVYISRMTRASSELYKATIGQNVMHFEFSLNDISGNQIWHAMATCESDGLNCVSFEGGIDNPIWTSHGNSGSGDGMIYFTPNAEWNNATSRFAVRININGQLEYQELTLVQDNVYHFAEVEGATAYIFGALQPSATNINQFMYTARATTKPSAGAMNHYILTNGATNQAQGKWEIREVAGSEEPTTPPTDGIVPGPYDQVYWGYAENVFSGSATLIDALSMVAGSDIYITLFSDVSLADTITISEQSYVVDLAGHTIESSAQIPFMLSDNETLKIKDSGETGKFVSSLETENYIFNIQNATLVIDGGTYETKGSGIIYQEGSSSKTTINGGKLYAGDVSAITITDGKLYVYGGEFYNGCMEAHISYRANTYNKNITIINLDTNGYTTIVINDVQNPVPVSGLGSADKLIVSDTPDGANLTMLNPGNVYYIDTMYILQFSEGHQTVSVKKGHIYTMPQFEGSYPSGMEFEGWRNIATNEIYPVGMDIIPTKNMVLYPMWIEGVIISVSYNANGGTGSMRTVEATAKAPFSLPYCGFTSPEGKVFDKWQINGATYNVGETVVLEETTEVIALWKDGIRVAYKANGGVGDDIVTYVESGTKVVLLNNTFTAPEGKSFKKWLVNGTEYSPKVTITITEQTEILALWKDGFSVTYNPNGGSGANREDEYFEQTTIVLPENFFTAPKNKAFKCWEVNGNHMMPGDSLTVSEQTTIVAVWKDLFTVKYLFIVRPLSGENQYTMEYSDEAKEGESYTINNPTELFADRLSLPYQAYYWEDEDGKQYQIGETTTFSSNVTLTLNYKWNLVVSIDADNDTDSVQYYDVLEGDRFTLPNKPESGNMGYIFDGWKNMRTGNMYNGGDETVITHNATFKAQWKKCTQHSFEDGMCKHCGIYEKCTATQYLADTKTVSVISANEGTFTVVFADYDGKTLKNIEYIPVTFTAETKGTVLTASITKDFSLSSGDKIFVYSGMTNIIPQCKALVIK